MSHKIENAVFSAREGAGWTGLGQAIPATICRDPAAIAAMCNAMYQVEKRDVVIAGTDFVLPDHQALVRVEAGKKDSVLHVASRNRYHLDNRQPVEIFEAFRDELAKENLEISHAAVLKGGSLIAVSAAMLDKTVTPGDKFAINNYVTLSTGYDGLHGTAATVNSIRVVCANTWAANLKAARDAGKCKTIRASTQMEAETLPYLMSHIDEIVSTQRRTYDAMMNAKLSETDVARIFADIFKINIEDLEKTDAKGKDIVSTKARNMMDALRLSYVSAPGASQGTAWGVFNAVTHFATHVQTTRDTKGDGKDAAQVASNMFGNSAKFKADALAMLTERYAVAA